MKKALLIAALSILAVPAVAATQSVSPEGHQPVRADIVNPAPEQFTINVKMLANLKVDDNAPTFAIYTTQTVPNQCGDFSTLGLNYQKPDKYTRVFNLSQRPEVLEALDKYGCVVIPNKPSGANAS